MTRSDPHSYTNDKHPLTSLADLKLKIDFEHRRVSGSVRLVLEREAEGSLDLDTRDLTILSAVDKLGDPVKFELHPPHKVLGSRLHLALHTNEVTIDFHTSPNASAIQWLQPEQTAGGVRPYVFTQCQPIHARSVFPCQDTPRARIRYRAHLDIPADLRSVMSAKYMGREGGHHHTVCKAGAAPAADAAPTGAAHEKAAAAAAVCSAEAGEAGGRAIDVFEMDRRIPPYLFALAVGDIAVKEISPRVNVYAEPSVVESAAHEFSETDAMVTAAEELFGPYLWEEFSMLVMPPSFPYGGMENPRVTFLTPTLLVGDRSLVNVVAHELAHSWTGNLVTNAKASDFWLNEGWTVYAERRILAKIYGQEKADLHAAIGFASLVKAIQEFESQGESSLRFTQLDIGDEGLQEVDPDEAYSVVPYEKGYLFLTRIEAAVGREAFDAFIQEYIKTFSFQSITTATFRTFLLNKLPVLRGTLNVDEWLHKPGLPSDAIFPASATLEAVKKVAAGFASDAARKLLKEETAAWGADEWQIFLGELPKKLPVGQVDALEADYELSKSKNLEIRVGFLATATRSGAANYLPQVKETLKGVGRMKYLRPLYLAMVEGGSKDTALEVFKELRPTYHPVAQSVIEGVISK